MIDATSSLEAAKGVRGRPFADYLAARGWRKKASRAAELLFLAKRLVPSGETAEIVLPLDDAVPDHALRIADALRTVAGAEGRDVFAVASEVRQEGLPPLAAPAVPGSSDREW